MYKKAISCWLRTAELEPTHPQINFRIAQAYWSDGDLKAARRYFLTELRGNPGDIDVILDFGLFLLEAGEIDSAKEKFHRILELKEDFAPAIFYLGEIAQADGEEALALELYAEAMEVDLENPPLAGPRFRLGQLALKAGKKKLARSYLVSELDLVADDADVLVSLGSMFLELDEFDYARHCLERAVEINCANAEGYYYLGLLKMKQFNFEAAADFLAHALDIHPAHIGALQASIKTSLELGRLDIASSRIARADMLQEPPQCLNRLKWQIRFARCAQKFQEVVNPSRN
jgi:tetratricopeptide (TPR) repeat protein